MFHGIVTFVEVDNRMIVHGYVTVESHYLCQCMIDSYLD